MVSSSCALDGAIAPDELGNGDGSGDSAAECSIRRRKLLPLVEIRCWANLRRHTSLLARRQASTYTHVRLGLPTSLAPCLARNLTQHRAQIDPLPASPTLWEHSGNRGIVQ